MPHPQKTSDPAWIRLLAPAKPSHKRFRILSLILAAWICFLLAMYFLTITHPPTGGRPTPATPVVA